MPKPPSPSAPVRAAGRTRAHVRRRQPRCSPAATVTPVGLFLPTLGERFRYGVTSKVTSDCLVDRLAQWWEAVRERFADITPLVINLDNGPKHQSRRPQLMQRMVDFVPHYHLTVRLAHSQLYYSKDHPIKRCWGILENHWTGTLLDAIDTVLQFARTMTWHGKHPVVALVTAL